MKDDTNAGDGGLRRRAEERLKRRSGQGGPAGSWGDTVRLVHELQVHQIELELQNEELRSSRDQLDAEAARYAGLYDLAPIGYFTLTRGGVITQANLAGARMLGLDRAAAAGRPFRQFVCDASRAAVDALLEAGGRSGGCQASISGAGVSPLEVLLTAFLPGGGRELLVAAMDITERSTLERALEKLSSDLKRKNAELSDFLYIASHDLRSPLVSLHGFSDMITDDCGSLAAMVKSGMPDKLLAGQVNDIVAGRIPEALLFINSSVNRMQLLISGILKMSRLGGVELMIGAVDMDKVAEDVAQSLAFQLKAAGAELESGVLPPCTADLAQVTQVFFNLVDNAIKYREPSRKLRVRLSGELLASGRARYRVTDNGRGLSADEASSKIWKLFYRGAGEGAGEGVGLSMAKIIIERQGGSISARPLPGGGAEFTVELPAALKG